MSIINCINFVLKHFIHVLKDIILIIIKIVILDIITNIKILLVSFELLIVIKVFCKVKIDTNESTILIA